MLKPRIRDTWLIHRHELLVLGILYAVFTGIWFAVGWLIINPLKDSSIVQLDQSISDWFANNRTTRLDSWSVTGSMLSDTIVKVTVTAVVAIVMLSVWKRWLEPLVIVIPLVLEALCFITVTLLVGRPRPEFGLETSPVNSSYPSGHVAAAVAYAAIVIVVFWHTRRYWIRGLAVIIGVLIPLIVSYSRMYRNMHFLTDVIFGVLLGGACVIATTIVLRRAHERRQLSPVVSVSSHKSEP